MVEGFVEFIVVMKVIVSKIVIGEFKVDNLIVEVVFFNIFNKRCVFCFLVMMGNIWLINVLFFIFSYEEF